jgi:hypothetical protein
MKRIVTLFIVLAPVLALGQWNSTGGTITGPISYTGGNVGIGTNVVFPDIKLHIKSQTPGTAGLLIQTHNNDTWFPYTDGKNYIRGTTIIGDISGNVGIGTSNPISKLHVKNGLIIASDPGFDNINVKIDGTSVPIIRFARWTGGGSHQHNAYVGQFYNPALGEYSFGIGTGFSATGDQSFNNTILTATLSGAIGIGTVTPGSILDIQANVGNPGLRIQGGLPYGTYYLDITPFLQNNPWSEGYNLSVKSSNGTFSNFMSFIDGKVGVGTSNPDAKLAVKGTVHAEEVKVDLNVPGPDYVFEENYPLPTLTETESYIKAHKHLPEVPSAKEMEANGINLSEMNMLLLKKVEELTLHLIEATKKIENQQEQINKLKSIVYEED